MDIVGIEIIEKQDKEIKRLKKEKEWLVNKIGNIYNQLECASYIEIKTKTELLMEMQQALKEK